MTFFIGLVIIAIGLILIIKTEWFLNNFGRIGFFEEHFGTSGGTRLGYKLIGMLAVFIGIMTVTGMISGFMGFVLSPLLQYYR
jgi:hypothetical protein